MAQAVLVASALPAVAAPPRLIPRDPLKQLLLDARVIAQAEDARLVLGTPRKDPGNPLIPADRAWENATNNLYPNVLWDEAAQQFKLWYKDVLADKDVIARMRSLFAACALFAASPIRFMAAKPRRN